MITLSYTKRGREHLERVHDIRLTFRFQLKLDVKDRYKGRLSVHATQIIIRERERADTCPFQEIEGGRGREREGGGRKGWRKGGRGEGEERQLRRRHLDTRIPIRLRARANVRERRDRGRGRWGKREEKEREREGGGWDGGRGR